MNLAWLPGKAIPNIEKDSAKCNINLQTPYPLLAEKIEKIEQTLTPVFSAGIGPILLNSIFAGPCGWSFSFLPSGQEPQM